MRRRLQFDKIVHAKIKQYIIISRFIALQSRFENAHGRSQFFLIFCSVALALSSSVPLSIGCVLKRSPSISMCIRWLLRIVSFSMHHEIRCSSFSLSAMNPWPDDVFFRPTIWCRYPKRAAHEFADPQYILFWTTDLVFEENCNQVTEIEITSTTFKQYKTPAINVC